MYIALNRFSEMLTHHSRDNLRFLFDKLGLRHLTEQEILFINEYVHVTRPLAKALDFLQGENHMYLGHLLPTINILKTI